MSAIIDKENRYIAINGEEAIDLILNEFYKQLVNSGLFPIHRTWHEFEFVGGVRVKGWSTKTEEAKFEVKHGEMGVRDHSGDEEVDSRVDVHLAPAPPDLLRESLPEFTCPKCERVSRSKAGDLAHQRFCKAEVKTAVVLINPEVPIPIIGQ
jgi:hypothetical protein